MRFSVGQTIRSAIVDAALLRERWQSGVTYNPLSARTARIPIRSMQPCAPGIRCTAAGC